MNKLFDLIEFQNFNTILDFSINGVYNSLIFKELIPKSSFWLFNIENIIDFDLLNEIIIKNKLENSFISNNTIDDFSNLTSFFDLIFTTNFNLELLNILNYNGKMLIISDLKITYSDFVNTELIISNEILEIDGKIKYLNLIIKKGVSIKNKQLPIKKDKHNVGFGVEKIIIDFEKFTFLKEYNSIYIYSKIFYYYFELISLELNLIRSGIFAGQIVDNEFIPSEELKHFNFNSN